MVRSGGSEIAEAVFVAGQLVNYKRHRTPIKEGGKWDRLKG